MISLPALLAYILPALGQLKLYANRGGWAWMVRHVLAHSKTTWHSLEPGKEHIVKIQEMQAAWHPQWSITIFAFVEGTNGQHSLEVNESRQEQVITLSALAMVGNQNIAGRPFRRGS